MARPRREEPEGLVYQPELVTPAEEEALLEQMASLRFDPIVMHGREARRTARHYGLGYDYGARTPEPGEPIPDWLEPARARAAKIGGRSPEDFVEALVQRYPVGATIGWHCDAPAFGIVVGISLQAASRVPGTSSPAPRVTRGSTRSRRRRSCASRSRSERCAALQRDGGRSPRSQRSPKAPVASFSVATLLDIATTER